LQRRRTFKQTDQPAGKYHDTLSGFAGNSDWRPPSVIELLSIVDYGHVSPAVNVTYFPFAALKLLLGLKPLLRLPSSGWVVSLDGVMKPTRALAPEGLGTRPWVPR
jgi:hypothetical protein